jgi:hypothetical protein
VVRLASDNEFDETFELARAGRDFEVVIVNHLKRRR